MAVRDKTLGEWEDETMVMILNRITETDPAVDAKLAEAWARAYKSIAEGAAERRSILLQVEDRND